MKLQIHVHTATLNVNKSTGKDLRSVVIIREDQPGKVFVCRDVRIDGPSRLIHRKKARSHEGAQIWIETEAPVFYKLKRQGMELPFTAETQLQDSKEVTKAVEKLYPHC